MQTTISSPGDSPRIHAPAASLTSPSAVVLARRALIAASLIGVSGDLLLRGGGFGNLGLSLFLVLVLAALTWLTRVRRESWTFGACLLLVPTLWFALSFAWRDSATLAFCNLVGLLTCLAALATALARGEQWEPASGIAAYLEGAVTVALYCVGGAPRLLRESGAGREVRASAPARRAGALVRGALIALPILLVFGSLLTAADPQFDRLVRQLFDVDFDVLIGHTVLTLWLGWLAAGYLRSALLRPSSAASLATRLRVSLGIVEVGVVLASLDALFVSFVLVQLRYFFGGSEHVTATAGVTYAEYARRGFFELVCVSALALPTLLVFDGVLRRRSSGDERVFRALAGVLLALLGVVMLSAMQRMRLYQQAYGLTETRLYASAAMGWIALVLAWFAATVLRGRRAPFAFGALVSAWGVVVALDLANPDALIARTNIGRLERGERFDPAYVTTLSGDAMPTLVPVIGEIEQPYACGLARRMLASTDSGGDWRHFNLARGSASRAVASSASEIEAAADCPGSKYVRPSRASRR